ncbi:hypothetical protein C4K22_3079 [Pseudomonas chlororaphis subsp. aurantiaca]|uniref:tetratricopeptide repeat protein n=1 Tax=Pseudomonas chlororaphis TaxID=587753 RepID=UPI000F54E8F5|nr:sel1 repeat family protein [Pseudomonas chlororaphis]AZD35822.1 hypothetical protein C4K22_3079 [Pseudomonas chlororaphis subsp. aurantiaca]AZD42159.1 hypothetical protein C4K21_3085 [Pseudomonas chlororaphis subsp. aurantiaca]AZD48384.1 hypothetical protein C4K20_2969 [Pseudomonas chlororaphis subsp. aurantiaca]
MKIPLGIAAILWMLFNQANAQLSSEQQTAKEQGLVLYNQFKAISAVPYLRAAADAGDSESQYFLGEAIRKSKRYITPEAQSAYEAAALQGDIYSMIRLAGNADDLCVAMGNCPESRKEPREWLQMAKQHASEQAANGNAESMYLMYELTADKKWLEQSAENGFALAQYLLGVEYREGGGFFLLSSSRAEAVERWMKASAEGGYPRGMMNYAEALYNKNDLEGFRNWTEKAAEAGYTEGVFGYGYSLSGKYPEQGFPLDLVKSYALLSLLLELDGGGSAKDAAEYVLPKIKEKMTPPQTAEAEKMSSAWKVSHPPLSFFPFKLSR